jgi:hypothetical protein
MFGAFWKQIVRSPSKSFAAAMACFVLGIALGPLVAWAPPAFDS